MHDQRVVRRSPIPGDHPLLIRREVDVAHTGSTEAVLIEELRAGPGHYTLLVVGAYEGTALRPNNLKPTIHLFDSSFTRLRWDDELKTKIPKINKLQ